MKKYTVYVSCEHAGVGDLGRFGVGRIVEAENEEAAAEIGLNAVKSFTIADSLAEHGNAIGITEEDKTTKMYKNCYVLAVEEYEEPDYQGIKQAFGIEFAED